MKRPSLPTTLEKAYGGCRICFGKGYATEITALSWGDDFGAHIIGNKTISNVIPCRCDRGQQISKILAFVIMKAEIEERKEIINIIETLKAEALLIDQTGRPKVADAMAVGANNYLIKLKKILLQRNERKTN